MSSLVNLWSKLAIDKLDPQLVRPAKVYAILNLIRIFGEYLLIISLTLYLLDTLSPFQVGIVWGLHFAVLAVLDYPTGIIGDLIGYKNVFLMAYIIKIGAILVMVFDDSYKASLIFMVLYAIALSQESGSLEAWFDNAYNSSGFDSERKIYTTMTARFYILWNSFSVIGLVGGGYITTYLSIKFLFLCYFISSITVFVAALIIMEEKRREGNVNYINQLKGSLSLFITNKAIFYYLIGTAILWTANESIWHTFLSIRLYRDYSGSVAGAGILRSILFGCVIFWQVMVVKFIDRFDATNFWIFTSSLISNSVFFTFMMFYYIGFPPSGFNFLIILGFISLYQIPMMLESIEGILRSKVTIDMIPNDYRNSMYSLLPTLARLLGSIFVFVAGNIIAQTSLIGSFVWLIIVSLIGSLLLGLGLRNYSRLGKDISENTVKVLKSD